MLNEFYTKGEEIANAITHGIGALLSIAALVILIVFSAKYGDAWYVTSYSIFGSCLLYYIWNLPYTIVSRAAK